MFRDAEAFAALRGQLAARGAGRELDALLERLRDLAERRRVAIGEADGVKGELNAKSREVGEKKRRGEDATELLATLGALSARTEAAAATAVVMMTTTSITNTEPPVEVHVDRPFLFVIQDRASGACLFLGRITNPQ